MKGFSCQWEHLVLFARETIVTLFLLLFYANQFPKGVVIETYLQKNQDETLSGIQSLLRDTAYEHIQWGKGQKHSISESKLLFFGNKSTNN